MGKPSFPWSKTSFPCSACIGPKPGNSQPCYFSNVGFCKQCQWQIRSIVVLPIFKIRRSSSPNFLLLEPKKRFFFKLVFSREPNWRQIFVLKCASRPVKNLLTSVTVWPDWASYFWQGFVTNFLSTVALMLSNFWTITKISPSSKKLL